VTPPIDLAEPFDNPAVAHRFADKVAVVTGAAAGIGRATALRLAAEGAQVWCADVSADGLAETEKLIVGHGGTVQTSVVDVTDVDQVRGLVADAVSAFGGLDVVCNIAGIGGMAYSNEETPERFTKMMNVNALGPFTLCQAALPHLLERKGNVVNMASTAGVMGQAYCAAYCASKHALVGITRSLAIEYGRQGIRFNAICPGGVNTNIINDFAPPEGASMSLVSRAFLTIEMQEPESIAAMVAYVGSDEAYYLNGAVLSIDGGTTAG
jgi:meso-butanediol dehydrogenase / (S,S)-butanediol dehydrogenase / diacetyl reductase